jgi:hypothetical protein
MKRKTVFKSHLQFKEVQSNSYNVQTKQESLDRFRKDALIFCKIQICAFLRQYVPGEADGFDLPENVDLSKIKWTYVLTPGTRAHIQQHLMPLPIYDGIVMFDMWYDKPAHARLLLTEEQAQMIRANMKQEEVILVRKDK